MIVADTSTQYRDGADSLRPTPVSENEMVPRCQAWMGVHNQLRVFEWVDEMAARSPKEVHLRELIHRLQTSC
jgi:hypothetical protein